MTRQNKLLLKNKYSSKQTWIYNFMALPALIYFVIFKFLPLSGVLIAFKNYSYVKGIFKSDWAGFKNFEVFFKSKDFWRLMRNTIGYNLFFLFITASVLACIWAILLYEVKNKIATKVYHTAMIVPNFISYVIVGYIVYTFLAPDTGVLNVLLKNLGFEEIIWYKEAEYWPYILVIVATWKDIGMASLYFYAALMSIDTSLFEAAELDGASRIKQIWYISVPELMPMLCTILILRAGSLLGGDWGLYFQVPMNQPALYSTTDVFSTYVYRGIQGGSFSTTAAVSLFNNIVGLVLVVLSNLIIKKIDPDKAIF